VVFLPQPEKKIQIISFFVDFYDKTIYNLYMIKNIYIFDLDQTVIDSSHRNPTNSDGTLNFQKYFKLRTRRNIFKDKLLPLANIFKQVNTDENYVIIATARTIDYDDIDFLKLNGLIPNKIISRRWVVDNSPDAELKSKKLKQLFNLKQFKNVPKIMFDDAPSVISKMREIGITTLNSLKINERLQQNV
jgi:hypothetical protein